MCDFFFTVKRCCALLFESNFVSSLTTVLNIAAIENEKTIAAKLMCCGTGHGSFTRLSERLTALVTMRARSGAPLKPLSTILL